MGVYVKVPPISFGIFMTNTPKTSSTNSNKDTAPIHQEPQPSRIWEVLSWLGVLSLIAYLVLAISETLNWQLSGDSPIMHYIAWLISQGQVPYRDIFDMNMPGTYLIHLGVISLLGNSSEMWRFFDVGWLALTCVIIIVYCKRQGMLAGVVAATIFACLHISSGEIMMGQRDFLLAPFLILGGHFVANVTENKYRLLAALLAGIIFGCAFWIKPHIALLFFVLFLYAKIQSNSIFVSLLMALGFLLPAGGVMAYLYLNQALLPWWEIVSQYLVPIYIFVGMNVSSQEMIFLMVPAIPGFINTSYWPFLCFSYWRYIWRRTFYFTEKRFLLSPFSVVFMGIYFCVLSHRQQYKSSENCTALCRFGWHSHSLYSSQPYLSS